MPAKKEAVKSSKNRRIVILIIILLGLFIAFLGLKAYKRPAPPMQPSFSSPSPIEARNLTGFYKGTLPCADCPGIDETLLIAGTKPDSGTFILEDVYQEKAVEPFQSQGNWQLINDNIIKIMPSSKNSNPSYFEIQLNGDLLMLDSNMQKIDSPFNQTLSKQ